MQKDYTIDLPDDWLAPIMKGKMDQYKDKTFEKNKVAWDKEDLEKLQKEVEVNLGDLRDLIFILTSEDSSGNTYTHEAYVTADQINVGSLIPPHDPSENADNIGVVEDDSGLGKKLDGLITSTGEKLMSSFRILGIIAAVAAVVMLALGISEIVIRRNKRSMKQ